MTDDDMIEQLIELYPKWQNESHVATLRVSGIKSLIRQAYQEGKEAGIRRARAEQTLRNLARKEEPSFGDIFESLLGRRKS